MMSEVWKTDGMNKITIDGVTLECASWGPAPKDAPTLVLLHEGLGSVAQWKDLPEALVAATGCGVFAYSRQGYGGSDPVALPRTLDYMEQEAEQVLGKVLDAARIEQAVLMGHSDGATIATLYGGSVSDMRVRGLILIAPHFFTEPQGLEAIRAAGQAFDAGSLKQALTVYHQDVEGAFKGWHDAWLDPGFAEWNAGDAIDHLRIPVLAIQSRDDPYGTLAQIDELQERMYAPIDTLILDTAGHAPHMTDRAATMTAITEFCTRLHRFEREDVALT